jgi:hypothetical protein
VGHQERSSQFRIGRPAGTPVGRRSPDTRSEAVASATRPPAPHRSEAPASGPNRLQGRPDRCRVTVTPRSNMGVDGLLNLVQLDTVGRDELASGLGLAAPEALEGGPVRHEVPEPSSRPRVTSTTNWARSCGRSVRAAQVPIVDPWSWRPPLGLGWAGPHWVRTTAETAGPRRARAVSVGKLESQATGHAWL